MGTDVSRLDRSVAAAFRGEHLGFVFQEFNLVPVLPAYENVEYPLLMVRNWPPGKRRAQAMRMLEAVGVADRADRRPTRSPAGRSSASRWRGRWCPSRSWCWPTNPLPTSTTTPRKR
jgi:putative ABC transport system ATP-binding protein